MASQDEARILGGHTAKVIIRGKEVGFFFDLSYSVDNGLQDAPVLGQTTVVEHQQTRYIVSGEFRQYLIRDVLVEGADSLVPMSAAEAVRLGKFQLDVMDKTTGRLVVRLVDVSFANNSSGFSTGQLVSQRVSFRAIDTRGGASQG